MDLFLEAGDQFAVGGDQRLLGFDLGDDGLLRGEGRRGISIESKSSMSARGIRAPVFPFIAT